MANSRKAENPPLYERLQTSLVPDWEQPYKVPENWCWARIDAVSAIYTGNSINKQIKEKKYFNAAEGLIYLATKDISFDTTVNYETNVRIPESEKFKIAPRNSTLLCIEGGSAGKKIGFVTQDVCFVNKLCAFVPKENINPKYLYYVIQSQIFKNQFDEKKHGLIGGVSVKNVSSIYVPIAPFEQQNRIVDRIESIFGKLDEAKQKVKSTLDGFEIRKAAVLRKAFAGELTAKWREEHGVEFDSWKKTALKDVCSINPPKTDTNGLPDNLEVSFLSMASISEVYGEVTAPQTKLIKDVKNGFTNFSEGDIVFAKITPCMENGKSAVVGRLVNGIGYGTTEFYVLRCHENLYNRYLYHTVRDSSFREKAKSVMSGAVGQQRVPKSFMENYDLYLPSFSEQVEIARILDELFAKEQRAKKAAEEVLEQIDIIRKSVLSRAFRGEFVTSGSAEVSAEELVKGIIESGAEFTGVSKAKPKRTVIPAEIKNMLSNGYEEKIFKLLIKSAPEAVPIQTIMSVSKQKFDLMDALRSLEQKKLIIKNNSGDYVLTR